MTEQKKKPKKKGPPKKLKTKLEQGLTQTSGLFDSMTFGEKQRYLSSLEPGGERHYIIVGALGRDTVAERVSYIAELMATGEWRSVLALAFGKVWNVSVNSIRNYSAEASRYVRELMGDKEEIRASLQVFAEHVAHEAIENGDRRNAIGAVRLIAEMAGLMVNRTELSGTATIQHQHMLTTLSDEELNQRLIEAMRDEISAGRLRKTDVAGLLEGTSMNIPDAELVDEKDEKEDP